MNQQIEGYRLSPLQARLWTLQKESGVYLTRAVISLEGVLEQQRLKDAIALVVARNEVLRTTFSGLDGLRLPLQVIGERALFHFESHDLGGMEPGGHENMANAFLYGSGAFDLDTGPLLQLALFSLNPTHHLLYLKSPSLILDAASVEKLTAQIGEVYHSGALPELSSRGALEYADISEWMNDLAEEKELERARAYWTRGDLSVLRDLQLGFETQNQADAAFKPQRHALELDLPFWQAIKALNTQRSCSVADFFLACWMIQLKRLTNRDDWPFGLGVEGRKHEELIDSMGLMAKYAPIWCELEEHLPLSNLIARLSDVREAASQRQEYFFWEKALSQDENRVSPAYFAFCYEHMAIGEPYRGKDLTLSVQEKDAHIDRFKLRLVSIQRRQGLSLVFHYDRNFYRAEHIELLSEQYVALARQATHNPDQWVRCLDMISDRERRLLLETWNKTRSADLENRCFPDLFEDQAARTPDQVAVLVGGETFRPETAAVQGKLTYQELKNRTDRLATILRERGVGPETPVGILAERSLDAVIGILSTLKAGGAFVPLDPAYPTEFLSFMLTDVQASLLLIQKQWLDRLPAYRERSLLLDEPIAEPRFAPSARQRISANHLAYVIYTSGSTGRPKGVMVHHGGLANYLNWAAPFYGSKGGKTVPVHGSLAFDATITSVFVPLMSGDAIVLIRNGAEGFGELFESDKDFGLFKVTPSHMDFLARLLEAAEISVRFPVLVVGGEALRGRSLTWWRSRLPDIRIVNEYGPTETVVGSCAYEVSTADYTGQNVPIGRPIANTEAYVFSRDFRLVAIGVVGELYIGGWGVARGYVNRPDLTAERFVPNPTTIETGIGARLYRTGDLVRYHPNGNLIFLGRKDHQVKIRGFRIEPGEIENMLSQHGSVRECAVIVREAPPGNRHLVAYTVSDLEDPDSRLRPFLTQKLPPYMIPTVFVNLEELPLTKNGKLDRDALPAPRRMNARAEYAAPRNPIEKEITRIWQEVFEIKKIGIFDNFFELGGHSLLATQIISRLHQVFEVRIPVLYVFREPTIAGLAKRVAVLRDRVQLMKPPEDEKAPDEEEIRI